ncbi:peptidyl-prolyl cis-trans isomerase [Uliginosibacterium sp. 31-12]|uniref:peptidylprolyl isomerase n=1 Tax=Uliginosibacterium sp. 31-12 TaxID=3062781 RepID=UPI0026E21BC4|nr:peptidyl-prolyl cis-trans isomerase [Uliginosibacterium sp. 31-12]MDO6386291.1 peptidylprolyl isomerase [Uliginosibacterium sp. 31-12]
MTHTLKAAVLAVAATLTLAACGDKTPADKVLTKVNGNVISTDTLDWLIKEQVPAGTPVDDSLRLRARDHLVQRAVLLEAARTAKLDQQADIKMRMEYVRDEQLVNAYIKDWLAKNPVTDEKVKAEFDKRIAEAGDTEFKARHILVEKEEDAKALIEKLKKGGKFADLAKASKDPGSAATGGDLGWARPATFVPEFAEALKGLEKGKFTETPVKSQFGYHVILLEDVRKIAPPPIESIKPQLQQSLQQEALAAYIKDLVAKAKIEDSKPAEPKAAASQ